MDAQLIANNPQDEIMLKIRSLQNEFATLPVKNLESRIFRLFYQLAERRYGLEKNQLLQFSDDHIEALAEIIYHQTKKMAIIGGTLLWTFGLLIPIFGWMFLFDTHRGLDEYVSVSYLYRKRYHQLRNILGDKFFSAKRLRELNP